MIYGLGVLALVVGLEHRSMMCVVLCEFSGASVINFNPASFVGIGRVLTVRVIVHKCVHKEYGFEKARGVKAMALIHLWFIGGEIVHLWYIGGELIHLWYIGGEIVHLWYIGGRAHTFVINRGRDHTVVVHRGRAHTVVVHREKAQFTYVLPYTNE